jgi:arsenate reductase
MAEAFLKEYAGDTFDVHSAGLYPAEEIHPLACKVMAEVGLPLENQEPEGMEKYLGRVAVRYAIIVCGATAEKCPSTWPGLSQRLTWPFEDPAQFEGTEEERLQKFREVRDKIDERLQRWLASLDETAAD